MFKDFILRDARNYLASIDEFRQDAEGEYRTQEELRRIENEITARADTMSKDFLDELRVKGVVNPDDWFRKREIVENTLISYQKKFFKWLQEQ